jgi:hypothetical protein
MKKLLLLLLVLGNVAYAACEKIADLQVVSWSYQAMLASYNMSFENADQSLSLAQGYYTKKAWSEFDDHFKAKGTLDKIMQNQLTVTVGLQTSPTFLNQKETAWTVQLPLLLNYESTGSYNTERQLVTLSIVQNKNCVLKIKKIEEQ